MKRSRTWTILALLLALPILKFHALGRGLLADSDTAFLLNAIRARHSPLSWFAGDWPLQNHFYRPLPTLSFELDNALYGNNAAGYGWTNAILCALCVWMLYWLLLEMTESGGLALAGAAVFTLWNLDLGSELSAPLFCLAGSAILLGLFRHSLGFRRYVPAALVLCFLGFEMAAPEVTVTPGLLGRMIEWLPGRTASVMTLFALCSMAAYVRFERARSAPKYATLSATDVPRNLTPAKPAGQGVWLAISTLAAAASLASYEQAVMLPAAMVALAVYLRLKGRRPSWSALAIFWGLLVAYLALRHFLLPSGTSSYQAQQIRHGAGVWNDLSSYALPSYLSLRSAVVSLSSGVILLLTAPVATGLLQVASAVVAFLEARRSVALVAGGWALSLLAYLPMAWVKSFAHYHYWPMALRTILILGLGKVAWQLLTIAACPPALQAPPRPSPAPGSLPHP